MGQQDRVDLLIAHTNRLVDGTGARHARETIRERRVVTNRLRTRGYGATAVGGNKGTGRYGPVLVVLNRGPIVDDNILGIGHVDRIRTAVRSRARTTQLCHRRKQVALLIADTG